MSEAPSTRELELVEAAAWADFYRSAGDQKARESGIRVREYRGMVITLAPSIDVLAFNRAIAAGRDDEIDEETLDTILATFRDAGLSRAFVQIAPELLTERVTSLLASRGLTIRNNWMKLWRGVEEMPVPATRFEVVEIGQERGGEFAAVVAAAFDWTGAAEGLIAAAVGRKSWRHYAALDEGRIVATAAMFVHGRCAWLDFAATLASARGKGAQSALFATRTRDAKASGCEAVIVETAQPGPDKPAPSYRNATRLGFEVAYERPNFLWTRD